MNFRFDNWFKVLLLVAIFLYVLVLAFEQYRMWRNSDWKVAESIVRNVKLSNEEKTEIWDDIQKFGDKDLLLKMYLIIKGRFDPF